MNRRKLKSKIEELEAQIESTFTLKDVIDYARDKPEGLNNIGALFVNLTFDEYDPEMLPSLTDLAGDFEQASIEYMPEKLFEDITITGNLDHAWNRRMLGYVTKTLHFSPVMQLWVCWYPYDDETSVLYFYHEDSHLGMVCYTFSDGYGNEWTELPTFEY